MKALIFGGESDMANPIQDLLEDKGYEVLRLSHHEVDVTDIAAIFTAIYRFKPQLVINLAGVSNLQLIKDSNHFLWNEEIQTNLIGSYNVAKICVDNKVQTMVFIGSVAGFHGKGNHSGYCASKAGVHSLVQSLAAEGHEAYAIAPGRVNTKLRERDFPGENVKTRLTTQQIAAAVEEIIENKYKPGDIVILRKVGYETTQWTYSGEPWRKDLKITPWEEPSGY